jgi:hypothetical protein
VVFWNHVSLQRHDDGGGVVFWNHVSLQRHDDGGGVVFWNHVSLQRHDDEFRMTLILNSFNNHYGATQVSIISKNLKTQT